MRCALVAVLLVCAASASAQKLTVRVANRQSNETEYTYVVPGHFSSYSNASANCFGSDISTNCSGSSTTSGYSTPGHQVSFRVHGATLALQLPDGRLAIVNCESKFAEHFAGPAGNKRSCREPLVEDIQADFSGNNARLEWVVSLDGKKKQSETYKVLAVLDKPKSEPAAAKPAAAVTPTATTLVSVSSTPAAADIEVDGVFVGSTPSGINLSLGDHTVVIRKRGFKTWERKLRVGGDGVKVDAELEPET